METRQKELFEQIFRPSRGREGHKKWFEIVHWVVMNVFEPFNSFIMLYLKLGPTQIGRKSGPQACCGTVTFALFTYVSLQSHLHIALTLVPRFHPLMEGLTSHTGPGPRVVSGLPSPALLVLQPLLVWSPQICSRWAHLHNVVTCFHHLRLISLFLMVQVPWPHVPSFRSYGALYDGLICI